MGSIYRVPFLYTDDLMTDMEKLHENGITTYAAHLKGKGFYDEESYQGPTAFLIGNEGNGLSDELSEKAKQYIKIPMEGQLESLNAAVAAAILMYEASRQRR
jgi:TrmH family RNA methyltransferase